MGKRKKKQSPPHVVLEGKGILCRHCGGRQTLFPEGGLPITAKSIRAFELLCEDFQDKHARCVETESSPSKRAGDSIDAWLMSGDTGTSSETIAHVMTGRYVNAAQHGRSGFDAPYDPDDFGRCYRLLQLFPAFRPRLAEVSARFPVWTSFVDAWDELTALYEEEIKNHRGNAPKLYARMRALREGRP